MNHESVGIDMTGAYNSARNRSRLKKVQCSKLSVCRFRKDGYQFQRLRIPCDSSDKAYYRKAQK